MIFENSTKVRMSQFYISVVVNAAEIIIYILSYLDSTYGDFVVFTVAYTSQSKTVKVPGNEHESVRNISGSITSDLCKVCNQIES